jgi:hypothetical protein
MRLQVLLAACGGFLLAVLWFDLMFDVQVRGRGAVSADALASISRYYRRVTTDAAPMSRLVATAMLVLFVSLAIEIADARRPAWIAWASLAVAASAIGLAAARTVRSAVRLGAANDPIEVRSRIARSVYRDHVYCFAAMTVVAALQVAAAFGSVW